MADRGVVVAYDAQAIEQGVFEHLMEPTAAFGATVVALDAEQVPVELAAYGHPFDGSTDFTSEFTYDRTGTGYYMEPADDTQDKLNGLSNGRSQVSGVLSLDMPFTASSAGASSAAPRLALDFQFSGSVDGSAATPPPFLTFLKDLAGDAAGSSFLPSTFLGLIGAYRQAVLASSPAFFLHLSETSGAPVYDDPDLGGEQIGQTAGATTRRTSLSLVPTAPPGALTLGNGGTGSSSSGSLTIQTGAVAPTAAMTMEFWMRTADNTLEFPISETWISGFTTEMGSFEVGVQGIGGFPGHLYVIRNFAGGSWLLFTDRRVDDNKPHHIAWSLDPATKTLSLYMDGRLCEAKTDPNQADVYPEVGTWGSPLTFGRRRPVITVDEIAWYSRALATAEVEQHYDASQFFKQLQGTPAALSLVQGNLTFAGGEELPLEALSAGSSLVHGNLLTGVLRALVGAADGSSDISPALMLRYGALLVAESATINKPRKHAVFSRAKV